MRSLATRDKLQRDRLGLEGMKATTSRLRRAFRRPRCSSTYQVLANVDLLRCWKETAACKTDVHLLQKQLDEQVAALHLPAIGAEHTVLAEEHTVPQRVKVESPFRPTTSRSTLPKALDEKVTSCSFLTRYRPHCLYAGTNSSCRCQGCRPIQACKSEVYLLQKQLDEQVATWHFLVHVTRLAG